MEEFSIRKEPKNEIIARKRNFIQEIIDLVKKSEWNNFSECPRNDVNKIGSALLEDFILFCSQFPELDKTTLTFMEAPMQNSEKVTAILLKLQNQTYGISKQRILTALQVVKEKYEETKPSYVLQESFKMSNLVILSEFNLTSDTFGKKGSKFYVKKYPITLYINSLIGFDLYVAQTSNAPTYNEETILKELIKGENDLIIKCKSEKHDYEEEAIVPKEIVIKSKRIKLDSRFVDAIMRSEGDAACIDEIEVLEPKVKSCLTYNFGLIFYRSQNSKACVENTITRFLNNYQLPIKATLEIQGNNLFKAVLNQFHTFASWTKVFAWKGSTVLEFLTTQGRLSLIRRLFDKELREQKIKLFTQEADNDTIAIFETDKFIEFKFLGGYLESLTPNEKKEIMSFFKANNTIEIKEFSIKLPPISKKDVGDDIPKVTSSKIEKDAEIGRGGFGVIYKGIWEGIDVAIKQLHLGKLSNDLLQEFINEAKIIQKCQHPNIVRIFAICVEPGKNSLIMEYLPNGSLFKNLSDPSFEMPWFLRWNIALDIARGLNYLHSQNIIHQDMKSMNILLDKDWKAKITDFGFATIKSTIPTPLLSILDDNNNNKINKIGSIRWNAPELFKRGTQRSKETDVYSFGMTLWEISSRKIPFYSELDDMMVATFIKDGEKENIPNDCPLPFSQIITKCWNSNPNERPSMSDVVISLEKSIDLLKKAFQKLPREEELESLISLVIQDRKESIPKINSGPKKESPKILGEEEYEIAIYLINSGYFKESIPLFYKSASLNYPPSFLWLYSLIEDMNEKEHWRLKVASNFAWYQSKSQDGKSDSLNNLGCCFYYGIGTKINEEKVAVDLKRAAQLYTKAAEQGLVVAQYNLGYCYENGEGVPQDIKKAAELYNKAAKHGLAIAQYNLGFCYQYGMGVPKDLKKAMELYTKAAEQGLATAQCYLGYCYEYGMGVSKDLKKATELFTKAAEQEHIAAQNKLKNMQSKKGKKFVSSDKENTHKDFAEKTSFPFEHSSSDSSSD